jgi:hypothetical protein
LISLGWSPPRAARELKFTRIPRYASIRCVQEESVMTHDTEQHTDDVSLQIQLRQHQKQRQQQQEHPYVAPDCELPEKQHQSKHNPISESGQFDSHSCDQ